jgi:hypothetical protein
MMIAIFQEPRLSSSILYNIFMLTKVDEGDKFSMIHLFHHLFEYVCDIMIFSHSINLARVY